MKPSQRIASLDVFRTLAILAVIGRHVHSHFLHDSTAPPGALDRVLGLGHAGVDLFFILSGYLIARIVLAELRATGRLFAPRFWYRRWMRTLPAYYVTLGGIAAIRAVSSSERGWTAFPSYLVFLQNYTNTITTFRFIWSWSLCVEEWFYLTLPVFLFVLLKAFRGCRPEVPLRALAGLAALVSVAARQWHYSEFVPGTPYADDPYWPSYLQTHCRLDGLAVGVFLATLPNPRPGRGVLVAAVLAAVALAGLAWVLEPAPEAAEALAGVTEFFRFQQFAVLAGVFGTFVYSGLAYRDWAGWRIPGAATLADLSYSLYLTHVVALEVVAQGLKNVPLAAGFAVFVALAAAASLAIRYLVEVPCLRLRDRFDPFRGPRPPAPRPQGNAVAS
jgi:peptidoglycan/LPS O-acetylase OafA/YrhL